MAEGKKIIKLQGRDVPLSWEANLDEKIADQVLQSVPYKNWEEKINNIKNEDSKKPDLLIEKIHLQNVDMFGPKVGFSKLKIIAKKWNERERKVAEVPGIAFMRGGAVGILCILKEDSPAGKEYALLTLQARVPIADDEFPEIPAGMMDAEKHKFAGKAAEEMSEETMLQIKEEDLFDLTKMAYSGKYPGVYPSAGGCDEFLRLFLYKRLMSKDVLEALREVRGGEGESEIIKIKLVPLEDLWREAPDAKALSSLYLYEKYKQLYPDSKPLPVDKEAEQALLKKIRA